MMTMMMMLMMIVMFGYQGEISEYYHQIAFPVRSAIAMTDLVLLVLVAVAVAVACPLSTLSCEPFDGFAKRFGFQDIGGRRDRRGKKGGNWGTITPLPLKTL